MWHRGHWPSSPSLHSRLLLPQHSTHISCFGRCTRPSSDSISLCWLAFLAMLLPSHSNLRVSACILQSPSSAFPKSINETHIFTSFNLHLNLDSLLRGAPLFFLFPLPPSLSCNYFHALMYVSIVNPWLTVAKGSLPEVNAFIFFSYSSRSEKTIWCKDATLNGINELFLPLEDMCPVLACISRSFLPIYHVLSPCELYRPMEDIHFISSLCQVETSQTHAHCGCSMDACLLLSYLKGTV